MQTTQQGRFKRFVRVRVMWDFIKAYVKSMRLYYAFITGIAGWIGVAYYEYVAASSFKTVEAVPSPIKKITILALLFLSWGINQIINDYLGLKEDRINAPQRPMVTGELHPQKALLLSTILLLLSLSTIYFYLEPIAIIPAILGILLNIIYEYAKGYGVSGNIVFGVMISMCTVLGFLAAGPTQPPYLTGGRLAVLAIIIILNGLMTFYTYFKDYKGDKAAKKKTLVVQFGLKKSRFIALLSAFLPSLAFALIYFSGVMNTRLNPVFILLGASAVLLQVWTGYLYFKKPYGEKTYFSLKTNFRACSCGQAALMALFNAKLAMMLFVATYMLVGLLFNLHTNSKA